MSASNFTGFYAKFDFKYLESCSGTLQEYEGTVYNYYYKKSTGTTTETLSGKYHYRYWKAQYDKWIYQWNTYTKTYTLDTVTYELKKVKASDDTQNILGWAYDGSRNYKTYSLLITSEWETEPNTPEIEIEKKNESGEALYGAKFDVTLEISGTDTVYGYNVNQTMTFTRVTNSDGIATISYENIKAEGVALGTFSGTITATFTETAAPAGYELLSGSKTMTITISKGAITKVSGGSLSQDGTTYTATISITDKEQSDNPIVQLAKVDKDSNLIEEADFKIYVSYTTGATFNSDGTVASYGTLVSDQTQIIRGSTSGGKLVITAKDFANMNNGFDITGYTGQITLDIVEINVNDSYSIQSEGTDVTLTYINGELVAYDGSDGTIVAETLTDYIIDVIYDYINGDLSEIPEFVSKYVDIKAWVEEQKAAYEAEVAANPNLSYDELKYEDILAYLTNYIEENEDTIFANSTISTDYTDDVVQIVIEDSLGDLPDMEFEGTPTPEPLLMTIAGTVFLDQTTTKASENESDGYYTQGEELLYGVTVTLYNSDGSLATLVQADGEVRTNPTVTDSNGFYEFNGVDPFGSYYVVFTYNGVEYTTTASSVETYNTDDESGNSAGWDDSSKASELTSARSTLNSSFSLISADTVAYDYYEIESIYSEIAARTIEYINTKGSYPDMDTIYNIVISKHSDDDEISDKIEYIKASQINAYAGYSSNQSGISSATANGTYPYSGLGSRFIINDESINIPSDTIKFAGSTVPLLYPGQLQVNLGLVERDSTDLSLLTDIVDTVVSINGYDTEYDYYEGESSYSQYIYEEDYNYSTDENANGVAYYTDDEVEFYMTYEIVVTNATLTDTAVKEIIDYYDSNFSWSSNGYTTSKGNYLEAYSATLNGSNISVSISDSSSYSMSSEMSSNLSSGDYKALYIDFGDNYITDGDEIVIRLTFKMDSASATLYNNLYTSDSSVSKMMQIGNYAEITAYKTQGGYLDSDSHPGNFSISEYETAKTAYQEAYYTYVTNKTETNSLALKEAMLNLTNVREDDAWYVQLTLANSGYVRTLTGSVWEAISDSVQTASDLQNYDGLLEYASEYGLKGMKVELVELCNDGTQVVRAQAVTGENGSYTFTSYIAGNYTIRFTYGSAYVTASGISNNMPWANAEFLDPVYGSSTDSAGNALQVNGQYYQSTKSNPYTDYDSSGNITYYWYNDSTSTRYSDAYDDSTSRVKQIIASIDNTEGSTSSDYEYDGVLQVQSYNHTDTIYAYTSTLNLEIEYIQTKTTGNLDNTSYEYVVENVDFGLTPRAYADLNIDKTISEIKIYLQDGTLQLFATAEYFEDGTVAWVYNNDESYTNIVLSNYNSTTYLDGLVEIMLDEDLLNGATLEVTYNITVSNDGEYDTIKYIYNSNGNVVAIAYYGESYNVLPSYETDIREWNGSTYDFKTENKIVNHNGNSSSYSLETYSSESTQEITTAATNIVDYIDPELNFSQVNKAGDTINTDWELTTVDGFNSSRELATDVMSKYNTIIKATNSNVLYTALKSGESVSTTLTLSRVLSTSSSETNDYEYSNLVEITKINNIAGRIIEIEGYDITGGEYTGTTLDGDAYSETSVIAPISLFGDDSGLYTSYEYIYPTLGTAKSETISIHAPTGLTIFEETTSNLGILLITLIILAVGIVLIKKFVMTPKAE